MSEEIRRFKKNSKERTPYAGKRNNKNGKPFAKTGDGKTPYADKRNNKNGKSFVKTGDEKTPHADKRYNKNGKPFAKTGDGKTFSDKIKIFSGEKSRADRYFGPADKARKRPPINKDDRKPFKPARKNHEPRIENKKYSRTENREAIENESFQLEGRNPVLEALKADRPLDSLLVKKGENEGMLRVIIAMAKEKDIVIKEMTKEKMDEISVTGKHQGVIAICAAHEYAELEDIFAKAEERNEEPLVIILDGITDPHNLGAIIRTAEVAGAHGVIIPKRRAAGLTAIVAKTSAGALQYLPVVRVSNISSVLEDLKKRGLWIACADMDGESLYTAPLKGSLGIVIGSEGAGVSRLAKEKCDFSVNIPMKGKIESLNASVAAGIIMYEILRRKTN